MAEEGKPNIIAKLWFPVVLGAIIGFIGYKFMTREPSEADLAFQDPEASMKHYLKTVYGWEHSNDGSGWGDLEEVIPKGDWQWFNDNWEHLFSDPADLAGGLDPNQAKALGRRAAMSSLLDPGPNRLDCAILCKDVGETEATMLLLKDYDEDAGAIVKVKLIKEGKKWKVANFAGGRNRVENTEADGDRRYYSRTSDGQRIVRGENGEMMAIVKPPDNQPAPAGTEPQLAPYVEGGAVANAQPAAPAAPAPAPAAPQPQPGAIAAPVPQPASAAPAPALAAPQPAPASIIPQPAPAAAGAPAPVNGAGQQQLLAPADLLMEQAAKDWAAERYARSVANAKNALAIYERHLGPNHPKVEEVKKMIESASQMQKR